MKKEDGVTISLRLPKKLLEEIDSVVSEGMFQSRSDFIREAIRQYLIRLEERGKPKPVMG
jgi:Arc/MetJ-type ribon-helix-helix transcriptional regulator